MTKYTQSLPMFSKWILKIIKGGNNMTVERIFDPNSNLSIEDIFYALANERVDSLIQQYYDHSQVNTSTSHSEGKWIA